MITDQLKNESKIPRAAYGPADEALNQQRLDLEYREQPNLKFDKTVRRLLRLQRGLTDRCMSHPRQP
jgi:hypothetical protein